MQLHYFMSLGDWRDFCCRTFNLAQWAINLTQQEKPKRTSRLVSHLVDREFYVASFPFSMFELQN